MNQQQLQQEQFVKNSVLCCRETSTKGLSHSLSKVSTMADTPPGVEPQSPGGSHRVATAAESSECVDSPSGVLGEGSMSGSQSPDDHCSSPGSMESMPKGPGMGTLGRSVGEDAMEVRDDDMVVAEEPLSPSDEAVMSSGEQSAEEMAVTPQGGSGGSGGSGGVGGSQKNSSRPRRSPGKVAPRVLATGLSWFSSRPSSPPLYGQQPLLVSESAAALRKQREIIRRRMLTHLPHRSPRVDNREVRLMHLGGDSLPAADGSSQVVRTCEESAAAEREASSTLVAMAGLAAPSSKVRGLHPLEGVSSSQESAPHSLSLRSFSFSSASTSTPLKRAILSQLDAKELVRTYHDLCVPPSLRDWGACPKQPQPLPPLSSDGGDKSTPLLLVSSASSANGGRPLSPSLLSMRELQEEEIRMLTSLSSLRPASRRATKVWRGPRKRAQPMEDEHNEDSCTVCNAAGQLLMCDFCPRSFHPECIGLNEIPTGDWECPLCLHGDGALDLLHAQGGGVAGKRGPTSSRISEESHHHDGYGIARTIEVNDLLQLREYWNLSHAANKFKRNDFMSRFEAPRKEHRRSFREPVELTPEEKELVEQIRKEVSPVWASYFEMHPPEGDLVPIMQKMLYQSEDRKRRKVEFLSGVYPLAERMRPLFPHNATNLVILHLVIQYRYFPEPDSEYRLLWNDFLIDRNHKSFTGEKVLDPLVADGVDLHKCAVKTYGADSKGVTMTLDNKGRVRMPFCGRQFQGMRFQYSVKCIVGVPQH